MDLTKLTRTSSRRAQSGVPFLARFTLAGARTHEFCGSARRRLALWLMRGGHGPVLWIRPSWHPDQLHMASVRGEIDPGRLQFVEVDRIDDILWAMEEALRAGAVPHVVADLPEPPGLTSVRRLHLAAEAGAEALGRAPVALILTPGAGGAAGVETRWQLEPAHGLRHEGWQLKRLRARDAAPGQWDVRRRTRGAPELLETRAAEPA